MINDTRAEWITHCLFQGNDNWNFEMVDRSNIHLIYTDDDDDTDPIWAVQFLPTKKSSAPVKKINLTKLNSEERTDSDVLRDLFDRGEKVETVDWLGELRAWAKDHPESPHIEDVNEALRCYEEF